jgi:hypothetical protein
MMSGLPVARGLDLGVREGGVSDVVDLPSIDVTSGD